jgi:hypothetical protein
MGFTIAQFNTAFAKSFTENFDNQTKEAIRNSAMNKIFSVEDTTEYTESYLSNEGVTLPSYLDESEDLEDSEIGKGYRTVFDSAEFGQTMRITYKARKKVGDKTEAIAQLANNYKN